MTLTPLTPAPSPPSIGSPSTFPAMASSFVAWQAAFATEINGFITELDAHVSEITLTSLGVTSTAAELNFVDGVTSNVQTQLNTKAANATAATAGNGLTGGGTLNAAFTMTLGTPTSISATSTNSVTSTSHTHAIDDSALVSTGMAGLAYGDVGTYSFGRPTSTIAANGTVAGSSLRASDDSGSAGGVFAGTWRNMGDSVASTQATVFLRIS